VASGRTVGRAPEKRKEQSDQNWWSYPSGRKHDCAGGSGKLFAFNAET
jgi:hypothetical protein